MIKNRGKNVNSDKIIMYNKTYFLITNTQKTLHNVLGRGYKFTDTNYYDDGEVKKRVEMMEKSLRYDFVNLVKRGVISNMLYVTKLKLRRENIMQRCNLSAFRFLSPPINQNLALP